MCLSCSGAEMIAYGGSEITLVEDGEIIEELEEVSLLSMEKSIEDVSFKVCYVYACAHKSVSNLISVLLSHHMYS